MGLTNKLEAMNGAMKPGRASRVSDKWTGGGITRRGDILLRSLMAGGLLLAVGWASPSLAQSRLAIVESRVPMSRGTQPALTVTIPKAKSKDVEKGWKEVLKSYKAKVKTEKGETFGDNALLKQLSENTVDIYTRQTDTVEGTALTMFVDLGGAFLASSTHPEQYKVAENVLYQFAVEQAKVAMGYEIEAASKVLETLQKDHKKLESDQKGLEREIEKHREHMKGLEEQIQEAQKMIEESKSAQAAKKVEVEKQTTAIQELQQRQKEIQ